MHCPRGAYLGGRSGRDRKSEPGDERRPHANDACRGRGARLGSSSCRTGAGGAPTIASAPLNHVTPAERVAAAGLVRDGESVSCSWDIRTGPQPGATVENQRYMLSTGLGLADEGRKGLLGGGPRRRCAGVHRHGVPRARRDPPRLAGPHLLGRQDVRRRAGVAGVRPPGRADARRAGRVRRASRRVGCCSTSPGCAASTCSPPTTTSIPRTSRRPSRRPASGSSPATCC